MSIRTLIVGILAGFCGISATIGVMTLQRPSPSRLATSKILVAKNNIDMGQQIISTQISEIDWNSEVLPPGAIVKREEIVDKYCVSPIAAGEVISTARIADSPTTLLPAHGMRAFAIEASSASTNVGRNLVPGNRVDIIWQTSGKLKDGMDPISLRLLQNVKILAVGKVQGDLDNAAKSITLEVKPKMDENLTFAQAFGKLSLSLRNPGDIEGVEPMETVKFKDLLEDMEMESKVPPAWETALNTLMNRMGNLEDSLRKAPKGTVKRETLERIGAGMRAITILTPNESSGVAGLLEPGDRVDLQLTLAEKAGMMTVFKPGVDARVPSETIIENIEVLAVDSNIFSVDGDNANKASRSVTLIVFEKMIPDIARAHELGTLTLTLRGTADSTGAEPRTVLTVDEFVARHLPVGHAVTDVVVTLPPATIRTLRGPAVQVLPFEAKHPSRPDDSL